jgi:predicted NUDIX family NTP pyrophosphohydrolase
MAKRSAGILPYRQTDRGLEVFLIHPGGPFWARKDDGAWSIAKGLYEDNEAPLAAAKREFREETGFDAEGDFIALGEFKQPGGKIISVWALEADYDADELKSNTFPLEWPPKSGRLAEYPEADRAGWFTLAEARRKILKGQIPIVNSLAEWTQLGATNGNTTLPTS